MRGNRTPRKPTGRGLGTEVPTGGEGLSAAAAIASTRCTNFEGSAEGQMVDQVVVSFEEDEAGSADVQDLTPPPQPWTQPEEGTVGASPPASTARSASAAECSEDAALDAAVVRLGGELGRFGGELGVYGGAVAQSLHAARGKKRAAATRGLAPTDKKRDIAVTAVENKKWVKPLFVHDPERPLSVLVEVVTDADGGQQKMVRCRLCRKQISFTRYSWTAAWYHIGTHNLTQTDLPAVVALADRSEADGQPFPLEQLPAEKQPKRDAAPLDRFVRLEPYKTGGQAYKRLRKAVASWVARDCMPMSAVETDAFRAMTREFDPRCPNFGRKAMAAEVSCYPVWCCCCSFSIRFLL